MFQKETRTDRIVHAQSDAIASIWEARRAMHEALTRMATAEQRVRTANQLTDVSEAA